MARSNKNGGFTLVELLVVIGIIAVLSSILLPVIRSVRMRADDVKCVANLRSIGQGIHFYASEYGNYLPPSGPSPGRNYPVWYRNLTNYIDDWQVYECSSKPSLDHDVPVDPTDPESRRVPIHYGMNFQLAGLDPDQLLAGNPINIEIFAAPHNVAYIADGAYYSGGEDILDRDQYENHHSIVDGQLYFPDYAGQLPLENPTASGRHRGNTNVLFLNGGVQTVQTKTLLTGRRGEPDCLYHAIMGDW